MRLIAMTVVVLTGILSVGCTNNEPKANEEAVDVKPVSCEGTPNDADRSEYDWLRTTQTRVQQLDKGAEEAMKQLGDTELPKDYRRQVFGIHLNVIRNRRLLVTEYNRRAASVNPCFFSHGGLPERLSGYR